ncbi:MAG: anthranilate synthase component I family protein [Candidatus Palauibacterales bacterium]|jgi:anthranilate synthase component I|nr:anthranilate synthase component I family protein [Candidatus Palauibacterales bacterium]
MQHPFDIAADLDTPVSAYLKLAPLQPRFLLESVEGGERLGRYSFIGFGEALEVQIGRGEFRVGQSHQRVPDDTGALLDAFRAALTRVRRLDPEVPGLPFAGGLVGVTGFEMAGRFENLRSPSGDGGALEAHYVAPESLLVFDHVSRRVALLHAGGEEERGSLRREVIELLRGPLPARNGVAGHTPPAPSLERPDFLHGVERVQRHISAGDIYQLVLSIRFEGRCDIEPFEAYRALRLLNPSPYMYFLQLDGLAVVGSSPEALVRLDGREAQLRPIAGTRPRGGDAAEDEALGVDLLADPKENAEHVMLVDLARNDLGRVAVPGSIRVDPFRTVERYSHVMHIVSGTRGVLAPGRDAFDLFAAAFPAGTVVGAPKIRAMEIIRELEPVRRGIYAGTVGYFGAGGSMDQAIAIRTLVFRDGGYAYQAGAGIVADSLPEREHAEILAKGAALEAALTLAEEGL